jgi:hypothetical protein
MRLREIGPGIGGLNYAPLLRDTNESKLRRALAQMPQQTAATVRRPGLWQSIRATARKMGQALVEARMAQARRMVELETARFRARDGTTVDRDAFGSRYY